MVAQPDTPRDLSTDFDHHVVLFPTRYVPNGSMQLPAQSASRPATRAQARLRTRSLRQVEVIEVAGRLSDVVQDLDRAIQLALAEGPRGVVCDLSAVFEGAGPAAVEGADLVAVEVLATAGRHVRDWPAISVAVACPDPRVREALRAHPLGRYLIVAESLFCAVSAVLAAPILAIQRLRLAAHPTAPRACREFVTRTLLDWRLGRVIPFATLVVGELVASSSVHAGTEIDLSVVWDRGALRLTVADHGPALADQRPSAPGLHGRGLTVVAGLSRTFGVLPTADGGSVVWAVLDAPRPGQSNSPQSTAIARQESLILDDACAMAKLPLDAGPSRQPT
jgi:hypothetical protein